LCRFGGKVTTGKIDQLKSLLSKVNENPDVRGSMVISKTGLVISADVKDRIQQETFAAMVATMMGAGTAALSEFGKGDPDYLMATVSGGSLISMDAGPKALLVSMVGSVHGIDKVIGTMRNVRDEVKDLVR
jgi:predicted regulator of Ras-like GTPase activity (Roadblock/LC7/MglB family)